MTETFSIAGHPISAYVRRVRRSADLSQRELAGKVGSSASMIGAIEADRRLVSLTLLQRILRVAGFELMIVDGQRRQVAPLQSWPDVADLAGRRFPAHLDVILDPQFGEWWADGYGLTAPPETFRRNRTYRDHLRRESRWQVRVAKLRTAPPPRLPPRWKRGDEWAEDKPWLTRTPEQMSRLYGATVVVDCICSKQIDPDDAHETDDGYDTFDGFAPPDVDDTP